MYKYLKDYEPWTDTHIILNLCALRPNMNISVLENRIVYYLEQLSNIDGKVPMGQLSQRYHQNKEKQAIEDIFGHASFDNVDWFYL